MSIAVYINRISVYPKLKYMAAAATAVGREFVMPFFPSR